MTTMHLTLTPVRMDQPLAVRRRGLALVFDGVPVDLSGVPEGGEAAVDCPWIAGPVTRTGGTLRLTILLPHAADAPEATRFPAPVTVAGDGPVALPPFAGTTDA